MKKPLYTLCPGCSRRVKVGKVFPGLEGGTGTATVKCSCGKFSVPYSESKIVQLEPDNPGKKAETVDFLLPMGWDRKMWENFQGYFGGRQETD